MCGADWELLVCPVDGEHVKKLTTQGQKGFIPELIEKAKSPPASKDPPPKRSRKEADMSPSVLFLKVVEDEL